MMGIGGILAASDRRYRLRANTGSGKVYDDRVDTVETAI